MIRDDKMTELTNIQKTIADQINAGLLKKRGFNLITLDDKTIGLSKGFRGMRIQYDEGSDTYNVTLITNKKIRGTFERKRIEEELTNVFWEDLEGIIDRHFNLKGFVADVKSVIRSVQR